MAEEKKELLRLNIFEIQAPDGGIDHAVEAAGSWNGLDVKFSTTIDKVRDFFTERRVGSKLPGVVVKE